MYDYDDIDWGAHLPFLFQSVSAYIGIPHTLLDVPMVPVTDYPVDVYRVIACLSVDPAFYDKPCERGACSLFHTFIGIAYQRNVRIDCLRSDFIAYFPDYQVPVGKCQYIVLYQSALVAESFG